MLGLEHAVLDALRTPGMLPPEFLARVPGGVLGLAFPGLQGGQQSLAGELAVGRLRTRILHVHRNAGGNMPQHDPRGDLINILPTRAAGPAEDFFQLGFV